MLVVVILVVMGGCRGPAASEAVPVVDLLRELERAEKRPPDGFVLAARAAGGIVRPALSAPVPSRVTWSLPLPRHGTFRAFVAADAAGNPSAAVRFRLGVSDHRIYEGIAERIVRADPDGWIEFRGDLSAYAGFAWSIFYRPDRVTWRVVLGADPAGSGGATAVWGSPEILTDSRSAREYLTRRRERQ